MKYVVWEQRVRGDAMNSIDTARDELMGLVRTAPSMVIALEEWIDAHQVITYDRVWSASSCPLTVDEASRLSWGVRTPVNKRAGFLRRGPGGQPLAYVEATFDPALLPPWAVSELEYTDTTIGEIVMGRLGGRRETFELRPISQFDRLGTPLCIEVRARLLGPVWGDRSRALAPLVLVRERIYEHVLEVL